MKTNDNRLLNELHHFPTLSVIALALFIRQADLGISHKINRRKLTDNS
jgi:hypothetical protein